MRTLIVLSLALFISITLFVGTALSAPAALAGKVTRVYDGDTIKVEPHGKVRLLGIDAPEREASDRDRYYLRKGIKESTLRAIAVQSRQFLARNAAGRTVTLQLDSAHRDKYGRLLAYVYLPDGRLLNRLLLDAGLATVYRRFNFRLKKNFLAAEKKARSRFRGIWSDLEK